MVISTFLNLIRARQWYKNLVVFLPLIFSFYLFNAQFFINTIIAFISLCLISSSNYILNDIIDIKNDREHPEKKFRPLASGKISVFIASVISVIFLLTALFIAYTMSQLFFLTISILFMLNQIYSIYLKNEPFVDIMLVSVNFVIRAVAGVFVINRNISPWLILCPFFLALFLVVGKRKADLDFLSANAYKHKEVLRFYSQQIVNNLLTISTTLLIISYSLYAFLSGHQALLITLPIAIYVVFRYLHLIDAGSEIARNPERMYRDPGLLVGSLIWIILIFLILYI